jgi:oxygen-dependent protoporphyrinogen oxidase
MIDASDDELEKAAFCEIRNLLGISSEPIFSIVTRYPRSMPQYRVGHIDRVERIERLSSKLPAFALAGNAYRGVGIPDCIASGRRAVEVLLRHMGF